MSPDPPRLQPQLEGPQRQGAPSGSVPAGALDLHLLDQASVTNRANTTPMVQPDHRQSMSQDPLHSRPQLDGMQGRGPHGGSPPTGDLDLHLLDKGGAKAKQGHRPTTGPGGQGLAGMMAAAKWPLAVALPIAAICGALWLAPWGPAETRAANWKYVEQAALSTKQARTEQMTLVDKQGVVSTAANANRVISAVDVNTELRDAIRAAVRGGDMKTAEELFLTANAPVTSTGPSVDSPRPQVLQDTTRVKTPPDKTEALPIPEPTLPPLPPPELKMPKFTPAIVEAVAREEPAIDFLNFIVFDSCAQDGDTVEVLLNGVSYCVIPMTNEGFSVNVAVTQLPAQLTVRAVRDGGGENDTSGGITAGFGFRNGIFYARPLATGEHVIICDVLP
jgi:hypothetical protein